MKKSVFGRKQLVFAIKLCIAIAVYVWLIRSGKLSGGQFRQLNISLVLLVVLLSAMAMFIPAIRWWKLLEMQKSGVTFRFVLSTTWASYFATLLLPGAAAGDAVKTMIVSFGRREKKISTISTIAVDRVLGLYSLVLLAGATSAVILLTSEYDNQYSDVMVAIVGTWLVASLVMVGCMSHSLWNWLSRWLPNVVVSAWGTYQRSPSTVWQCLLLSIASTLLTVASLAVAFAALGIAVSPIAAAQAGPLAVIANCLPLAPGGLGVGEAAAETAFRWSGYVGGASAMLLVRFTTILCSLPGILVTLSPKDPGNVRNVGG